MGATKEAILALAGTLARERVQVPGLADPVWVRGLTGAERDAYEQECIETRGKARVVNMRNARARLVVRAACDEAGARLFADGDADALGGVPAAALDALYAVASRLSGLSARDAEDLAGN